MTMPQPQTYDIREGTPPTLSHVIGQARAVQQLRTALDAHFNDLASNRGPQAPAFPHTLLVGPPGVGKSLLASILAKELGGHLHEELAQNLIGPAFLHGLLMLADEGDTVFVDEVHELAAMAQTTLYRALEERRLFLPAGGGERQTVQLPPFTFVAATTDEWALTKPLRDRFRLILRLEHYSPSELAQLLAQRARRLGWAIADETIQAISVRGRGTPRIALRLLEATRRVARAAGADDLSLAHFNRMTEIEGVDAAGLDSLEGPSGFSVGRDRGPRSGSR
jgi:Holliday junction DNA helicase RuvB